ncbi:MAG: sugar phosphate isomerase/epimerase [Planctomycetes bacterium]|nr:sugar phosphate isomerase/epimerase [Planctomycetota bacterium]
METQLRLTRRCFLQATGLAMVGAGLAHAGSAGKPEPLKIGIRAASMRMAGTPDVFKVAATIPGIRGVELQMMAGKPNLRDEATVRRYKKEADRWGLKVPALAGIWEAGVTIRSPRAAESVIASIRAAERLDAHVILAAFFRKDAPDMSDESSYGPIVTMLRKMAQPAADAGVVIGLENSLGPADNRKLVDLVGHPAVAVYYDLHNMDFYGHGKEAIPGIKLLGKDRICMVHVKNGKMLIAEPGPIDWPAAFRSFREIGYAGWYVYETAHDSTEACLQATKKNNEFLRRQIQL